MLPYALVLLLLLSVLVSGDESCGPPLYTAARGYLPSHLDFGRRPHPRNLTCEWRILAAPRRRILLLASSMNLESESECRFDSVRIYDTSGNASVLLGTACGGDQFHYFLSGANSLLVRFRADLSIEQAGFTMRYLTLNESQLWASPMRGRIPRPSSIRRCNLEHEFVCRKSQLCLPRALTCDFLDDCGDASDETICPKRPPVFQCRQDQFQCTNGQCIPYPYKCDRRFDCNDRSDEGFCGPDGVTASHEVPVAYPMPAGSPCGEKPIPHFPFDRVVGGQVVRPGSWPWMASLRFDRRHMCGGAVIHPNWILTAAHCFQGLNAASLWRVHAGRFARTGGRLGNIQSVGVARLLTHPRYQRYTFDFDVALMRLERPLQWTSLVLPICMPSRPVPSGDNCYVAGWGNTMGTGGAGRLKQGYLEVFQDAACSRFDLTPRMLCAGRQEGGVDTCQGDSGGPLMCLNGNRWEVSGITSFGGFCGEEGSPGVYARVWAMREWIEATMRSL